MNNHTAQGMGMLITSSEAGRSAHLVLAVVFTVEHIRQKKLYSVRRIPQKREQTIMKTRAKNVVGMRRKYARPRP